MKQIQTYSRSVLLLLCVGFFLSACNKVSEDTKTKEAVKSTTVSEKESVPLPTLAPTPKPVSTFTATPKPVERKDVRIIGLMIGTGLDKHNEIKNPTSKYKSGDSIFAIVRTDGTGPDATIKVRCKDEAGKVIFEESKKITAKGSAVTPFTLTSEKALSPGSYHLEGLLDDYPAMGVSLEVSN
jgi:hypothetical protein